MTKKLIVEVANPYEENSQAKHGEGFGLIGLNKRLRKAYNGEADVSISKDKGLFRVTLTLPLRESKDE